MSKKKKVPLRLELFFLRILDAFSNFFFLGLDGNRFRLADLGGLEPLRKLIRQKLVPGRGLEVCCAPMVQRLLPRANVHESCMLVGPSTRGHTGVGAPRTGSHCLPPSWTARPREELLLRMPDIFSWRFFLESAARTYTIVRLYISSTKSSSAILTPDSWFPPQNYPDLKVSDRSEHFFKPGDISVPSPLFVFLRIRRLTSTNLVETRALRTIFFVFHRASSLWQRMVGLNFQRQGRGGEKVVPPSKKYKRL